MRLCQWDIEPVLVIGTTPASMWIFQSELIVFDRLGASKICNHWNRLCRELTTLLNHRKHRDLFLNHLRVLLGHQHIRAHHRVRSRVIIVLRSRHALSSHHRHPCWNEHPRPQEPTVAAPLVKSMHQTQRGRQCHPRYHPFSQPWLVPAALKAALLEEIMEKPNEGRLVESRNCLLISICWLVDCLMLLISKYYDIALVQDAWTHLYVHISYTQAIELAKTTSDFLWWGSALEGLTCATLLLEYLHADVGVSIADMHANIIYSLAPVIHLAYCFPQPQCAKRRWNRHAFFTFSRNAIFYAPDRS